MNKEVLRQVVLDQRRQIVPPRYIRRDQQQVVQSLQGTSDVVIISGIRRCGKSTLLDNIRSQNSQSDYYLNFDDERLVNFTVEDFAKLVEVFLELFGEQNTFYFDEIQNIPNWERFVRRLHNEGQKVYITSSNASMLSRELGTHLTGRYVELQLYPFSFVEFLRFEDVKYDEKLHLNTRQKVQLLKHVGDYLEQGGLPGYLQNQDTKRLQTLYESIIYRDIVVRYNIPDAKPLKEMIYFCASNIGKELSFNAVTKLVGLKNPTSIKEYFAYCEDSFLMFLVPQFAHSLKKQIYAPKKVYFIDTALARSVGFRSSSDYGRFLENMVFLQLKRQGKEVYYHRNKKECDFLVRTNAQIVEAIQVTADMSNDETRQREITGLCEAMEQYNLSSGVIITVEESGEEIVEGKTIKIIPIWKWLLEN